MATTLQLPHRAAIDRAVAHPRLPDADRAAIRDVLHPAYLTLRTALGHLDTLDAVCAAYNAYRHVLEVDVIHGSAGRFLPRQRGQLKLESTALEEFCAAVVARFVPDLDPTLTVGPARTYAGMMLDADGTMTVRTKDQDVAIGRPLTLSVTGADGTTHARNVFFAPVTVEAKTNLDATMLASINATARDLKWAVTDAAAFVVCDWLDATPHPSGSSFVDRVFVLRGNRPTTGDRPDPDPDVRHGADAHCAYLAAHPVRADVVAAFVAAVAAALSPAACDRAAVVDRGWF